MAKVKGVVRIVANIFIAFLGAGMLGLPYAFKEAGFIEGFLIMAIIGFFSVKGMLQLVDCKYKLKELMFENSEPMGGSRKRRFMNQGIEYTEMTCVVDEDGDMRLSPMEPVDSVPEAVIQCEKSPVSGARRRKWFFGHGREYTEMECDDEDDASLSPGGSEKAEDDSDVHAIATTKSGDKELIMDDDATGIVSGNIADEVVHAVVSSQKQSQSSHVDDFEGDVSTRGIASGQVHGQITEITYSDIGFASLGRGGKLAIDASLIISQVCMACSPLRV